jgi:hypothetical protein
LRGDEGGLRAVFEKSVVIIDLHHNALTGTIPSELGQVSKLGELIIGPNALTGTIPSELGHMSTPQVLYLRHNALTGTIPSELGHMSTLQYLTLEKMP